MRYFVTGGTGFLGGYLVERLRSAGHVVVALVRDPSRADALEAMGADLVQGDVTDADSMRPAMRGADGIFHVAGWYKIGQRDKHQGTRTNVDGTRNVLALMQELEIPKGVYTSSLAAFGDTRGHVASESWPLNPRRLVTHYDRTKARAHFEVALPMMRHGLPLIIVQPGIVYGPGDTSLVHELLVRYLQGRLRALPSGPAYNVAHVEDIAQAHVLAMTKGRPGSCYIIGGPASTLDQIVSLLEDATGIPAPTWHLPAWLTRTVATLVPAERVKVLAGVTYLGDDAKARKEWGWSPRSMEDGMRQTVAAEMRRLAVESPAA